MLPRKEAMIVSEDPKPMSAQELAAEGGTTLPDKEVMSLLDLNANLDLALDAAAPIDLAVGANANIAAPIDAAVGANVLSAGSDRRRRRAAGRGDPPGHHGRRHRDSPTRTADRPGRRGPGSGRRAAGRRTAVRQAHAAPPGRALTATCST